jgi:phytoene dehydrogenase-like protein
MTSVYRPTNNKEEQLLSRYDSIIIGAGHNGLACAAYLSKAGQRVLVVEAAMAPGGLAATREFHPGFRATVAHSAGHFSKKVADDLDLAAHGLNEASTSLTGLNDTGAHVRANGSLEGASDDDARAYQDYSRLLDKFADAMAPFWLKTMPRIKAGSIRDTMTFAHLGLNIRRMGKDDMREFLRIASLPARDLMDEFFEGELLKATLCWDGLIGSRMAPRSPNSAVLAMLYRRSGMTANVNSVVKALLAASMTSGTEFRFGEAVEKILINESQHGLSAQGVKLANGETIEADTVISATDPQRTFLNLVGVEYLDIGFTNRIRRLRCKGLVAKLHLALDDLPQFDGLSRPDGRLLIAPSMDAIEFAFDDAKYGEYSAEPVLEITIPSLTDATLAPSGKHVLSAHIMYVPHALKGGWTDAARKQLLDRAVETIARYAPGLHEQVIHGELLTPADLEREYRVTGGHWHHTEFAMDQLLMMRPTYEAAQYGTPIPGLYLCGAGCHPGGDIAAAAGHNAAQEVLR